MPWLISDHRPPGAQDSAPPSPFGCLDRLPEIRGSSCPRGGFRHYAIARRGGPGAGPREEPLVRSRLRARLAFAGSALLCGCLAFPAASRAAGSKGERRLLTVDDQFAIRQVSDPQISPDGRWIAYTVSSDDLKEDETRTRIWMVPAAGGEAHPLTAE